MTTLRLLEGDCLASLRAMPDACVDSIVTDPPYGLSFMGKRWDYDVPSTEIWAECLRVLKPGGHLLAFAGTRTQHRMAVRIEDAGFEIRDMIAWVYGSGFPKSLDVSKAIDKAAGAEREKVLVPTKPGNTRGDRGISYAGESFSGFTDVSKPVTDAARQWQGWGTALKPALEPITVARKPLGTCATNVLQTVENQLRERGASGEILWKPESASGAAKKSSRTNLSSTEVQRAVATSAENAAASATPSGDQLSLKSSEQPGTSGLKQTRGASESFQGCTTSGCANPSSLHMGGCAPAAENVSETSSQSTTSTAAEPNTASKFTGRCTPNCAETDSRQGTESFAGIATGLTGSMETVHISRDSEGFFLWPKGLPEFVPGSPLTVAENVLAHGTGAINVDGCRVGNEVLPAITAGQAKIGTFERGVMLTPERVGRWPANLIHDGSDEVLAGFPQAPGQMAAIKGTEPSERVEFAKRNETDKSAARFFYCAKSSKADRGEGNTHPTVKPTDLMRYLCRLVTPPGGVVLDPFMGSGSTGCAAVREGFRFIGCELSPEYFQIADARITAALVEDIL